MRSRFSLVIPAYNEANWLPALLDTVNAARAQYRGGADAIEVIVANNVSTDETVAIAEARGCRVAHVEKRAIAAARNGGAATSQGEVICFIDADSRVHKDTSTRKFDKHGDWHYFTHMPRVGFWMLVNKKRGEKFTQAYWYEDR